MRFESGPVAEKKAHGDTFPLTTLRPVARFAPLLQFPGVYWTNAAPGTGTAFIAGYRRQKGHPISSLPSLAY